MFMMIRSFKCMKFSLTESTLSFESGISINESDYDFQIFVIIVMEAFTLNHYNSEC